MSFSETLTANYLGYEIHENHTIMSGYVVRWQLPLSGFEVSASRDGVMLQGHSPILNDGGLKALKTIIDEATDVAHYLGSCYGRPPKRDDGSTWQYAKTQMFALRKAMEQEVPE